jgi:hypothetical protein
MGFSSRGRLRRNEGGLRLCSSFTVLTPAANIGLTKTGFWEFHRQ